MILTHFSPAYKLKKNAGSLLQLAILIFHLVLDVFPFPSITTFNCEVFIRTRFNLLKTVIP